MSKRILVVPFVAFTLASCGAGKPASLVRPDDPTANNALGKKVDCTAMSEEPQLLTLDWDDTLRIDLEQAMKKKVAVVRYDCNGFKVMRDCEAAGSYEYAGVSAAKTTAKIADEDQLKVNLPLGAASMNGEIQRGSTIDIIYVAVGQQATTVHDVPRTKLSGKCDGATHTVRTANLGAFALTTGTKGEVNAAVGFLGKGASGESKSTRGIEKKNGELAACEAASDTAAEPTSKCKALVQLLLSPIQGDASAQAAAAKPAEADPQKAEAVALKSHCPAGYKLDKDGLCQKPEKAVAFACEVNNFEECKAQCEKGSARSCYNAGVNRSSTQYNKCKESYCTHVEAFPFMEKACALGVPEGCGRVGYMTKWGYGTERNQEKAEQILLKACAAGDPASCMFLASQYKYGSNGFKRDASLYFQQNKRACALGEQQGCVEAANALIEGVGVTKDLDAANALLTKACDAGNEMTCKRALNLRGDVAGRSGAGEKIDLKIEHVSFGPDPIENPCGQGLRVDLATQTCVKAGEGKMLCDPSDIEECTKRCEGGDGASCLNAAANRVGKWNAASKTGKEDAFPYLEKSCNAGYGPGCGELANALHWGYGVKSNRTRSVAAFEKACGMNDVASCKMMGRNLISAGNGFTKDLTKGISFLKKACDLSDINSCIDAANYLESGTYGVKKDPKGAGPLLDKACKLGAKNVCSRAERALAGGNVKPDKPAPTAKKK